jgi:hypothetical protein
MYILVYIKKFMSMKPNPKEINIILNILKGAQFEFLPRAPFYIDTPLSTRIRNNEASNPPLKKKLISVKGGNAGAVELRSPSPPCLDEC